MDDEIPGYCPVDKPLHLTKELAAARQVQFAVGALEAGSYDAAITLAGAAEELLPGDPEIEITTQIFQHPNANKAPSPYTWREIVNFERNWLKHRTENDKIPSEITLDLERAPIYVYRAMRKLPLELLTQEMLSFERWYRARIAAQIKRRDGKE